MKLRKVYGISFNIRIGFFSYDNKNVYNFIDENLIYKLQILKAKFKLTHYAMKENKIIREDIANLKSEISNEFDLKIVELYYKEIAPKKTNRFLRSPLFPIFLSAFFAILGTAIGAYMQGRSNLVLEQQKYESSLILKMVEVNNTHQAMTNLAFICNLGLIKNDELILHVRRALLDSTRIALLNNLKKSQQAELDSEYNEQMRENQRFIKKFSK